VDEQGTVGGITGNSIHLPASAALETALAAAYDRRPSALILCDHADHRVVLERMTEAAGARLLGALDVEAGLERLDMIASVRLLVVRVGDGGGTVTRLLARLEQLADSDGTAAILAVTPALLEEAFGAITSPRIQILCDAPESEIAAALALAVQPSPPLALHDIGRESEALRLQRLSEEVSRIARTLASLSGHGDATALFSTDGDSLAEPGNGYTGEPGIDMPRARSSAPVTARDIRDMLRLRRLRDQFFPGEMFADPAWDMLLDLMAARLSGQRVSVSSLCIAAAVPATTALRWIRALTDNGLFLRQADPADGRRVFIALSEKAADAMTNFFTAAKRGGKAMLV
jgi:hypothetical protein